ncbi:MAG: N-acetyl-gamma-glutamyl-phosphate reductase, partial [Methylocystis sp.]
MTTKIFIDGDAGTTGLEIRERLARRSDITLLALPQEKRKNVAAKRDMLASVDIAILCLPDDAAKETVALCDGLEADAPRLFDASTAHRVAKGWVYGFAELCEGQAAEI